MLPVMVALILVLVRVNTAIQVSIVNQQYARAQATWLAFNSATYPELHQRVRNFQVEKQATEMVLGVSGNTVPEDAPENYQPAATTQLVTRKPGGGSDDPQTEPDEGTGRSNVRIRTTVSICTEPFLIDGDTPVLPLNEKAPYNVIGPYNLKETSQFVYCKRPT